MGNHNHLNYRAPDCPGCGKPDAARIGKSTWGHDMACCSEECGQAVAGALARMEQDDRYKFFVQMLKHAESEMLNVKLTYFEMLRAKDEELLTLADENLLP